MDFPELLSIKEAADVLGVDQRSVRRLIEERKIPYYLVTDTVKRIARADLLAYLEQRRRAA